MGYAGQTYQINCAAGGLSANPNIDAIKPEMMVLARNINIYENGRGKRGGTAHVYGSAFSGAPRVMGVYQFRLLNGSNFIVTATADGKIYKDSTNTIKTGLTATKVTSFETFLNTLYITNGADRPQTWDGAAASTSNLTNIPTSWSGLNWPKQLIKHGRGNSERLWAFVGNTVYASKNGTDDFSDANVTTFLINTPDGYGLTGGIEHGNELIVFGKRKSYRIDDSSTTVANWGYVTAIWEGGVAHHKLIVKTPNDVLCMMDDGTIYSINAVQSYGDYKTASITKPSWIDKWIRDNCNLAYINDFHAAYDPELRLARFFVVRNGKTTVDTCLVYAIDKGAEEGWTIHDNQNYASGFSASCSAIIHKNPAEHHSFYVYTGDYSGFLWDLEETNRNDNGNPYYAGFKTPNLVFDNARLTKRYDSGWVVTQAKGNYNLYVNLWVDGNAQTQQSVSLAGAGAVYGSALYGTATYGGNEIINKPFPVGNVGKRIQYECYNSNTNEDFFISQIMQDFKPLSNRPS